MVLATDSQGENGLEKAGAAYSTDLRLCRLTCVRKIVYGLLSPQGFTFSCLDKSVLCDSTGNKP